MTLIRFDRSANATQRTLGRRRGRELLELLLAGFCSRSYPLLGPMCIWLPYPPPAGSTSQQNPDSLPKVGAQAEPGRR